MQGTCTQRHDTALRGRSSFDIINAVVASDVGLGALRALATAMSATMTQDEAQLQLYELEMEEDRIMRELREMDEKVETATIARTRFDPRQDPRVSLNSLLLECEQEVRDVKGYISSPGPPLQIARCRRGETIPPHATFLSRPKATGVDFTVPVTSKEYKAAVKNPIFLNTIRDKCKANEYSSADEYIADMKQLHRNTSLFIKRTDLHWVVQHSKLLLECAVEAIDRRRKLIDDASVGIPRMGGSTRQPLGKRKRTSTGSTDANGTHSQLNVGTTIQVYWEDDRKWHTGVIREKGSGSQVQIEYNSEPNGGEWIDLQHEAKWRLPTTGRSRRIADNNNKRKKGASTPSAPPQTRGSSSSVAAWNPDGATKQDLTAMREELLSVMEENRISLMNHINERFVRIDNKLNRSDPLHRVLIAVSDMQKVMEEKVDKTDGRVVSIEKRVEELQASMSSFVDKVKSLTPNLSNAEAGATADCDATADLPKPEEEEHDSADTAPKDTETGSAEAVSLHRGARDTTHENSIVSKDGIAEDAEQVTDKDVVPVECNESETVTGKSDDKSVDEPDQETLEKAADEKASEDVPDTAGEVHSPQAKVSNETVENPVDELGSDGPEKGAAIDVNNDEPVIGKTVKENGSAVLKSEDEAKQGIVKKDSDDDENNSHKVVEDGDIPSSPKRAKARDSDSETSSSSSSSSSSSDDEDEVETPVKRERRSEDQAVASTKGTNSKDDDGSGSEMPIEQHEVSAVKLQEQESTKVTMEAN